MVLFYIIVSILQIGDQRVTSLYLTLHLNKISPKHMFLLKMKNPYQVVKYKQIECDWSR